MDRNTSNLKLKLSAKNAKKFLDATLESFLVLRSEETEPHPPHTGVCLPPRLMGTVAVWGICTFHSCSTLLLPFPTLSHLEVPCLPPWGGEIGVTSRCVCVGGVVHTGRGGHGVWVQGPTQLLRMCMAALFTKEKETGNKLCLSRGEWRNECGTCHTWYRSRTSSREDLGAPRRRDGELGVRSFSPGQLLRRSRQPHGASTCGEGHDAGVWECAAAGQGLPQEGAEGSAGQRAALSLWVKFFLESEADTGKLHSRVCSVCHHEFSVKPGLRGPSRPQASLAHLYAHNVHTCLSTHTHTL